MSKAPKKLKVLFAPEAQSDLVEIYNYIAEKSYHQPALAYTERIHSFCLGLATFPQRGTLHDNLRPGLRTMGLERRITITFHIQGNIVMIDRILYGGRDIENIFENETN